MAAYTLFGVTGQAAITWSSDMSKQSPPAAARDREAASALLPWAHLAVCSAHTTSTVTWHHYQTPVNSARAQQAGRALRLSRQGTAVVFSRLQSIHGPFKSSLITAPRCTGVLSSSWRSPSLVQRL